MIEKDTREYDNFVKTNMVLAKMFSNFYKLLRKKLLDEGIDTVKDLGYSCDNLAAMFAGTALNIIDSLETTDEEKMQMKKDMLELLIDKAIDFNKKCPFDKEPA